MFLTACSSSNEEVNQNSTADLTPQGKQQVETHSAQEGSAETGEVGFEMAGGVIEEAANVPQEEKELIIDSFNQYIQAFNEEDINTYMAHISENPQGFNYEEERTFVTETFEQYDATRTPSDITVIKYSEQEAQVFAKIDIELEQKSTGGKVSSTGRQVTVFSKEQEKWLVTSVYFIRD